jgi:uncharacterized protein
MPECHSKLSVAISGSSGLIGSSVSRFLIAQGHRVVPMVRRTAEEGAEISWDPTTGKLDPTDFEEIDAVVHLAGAGIADKRWTPARKELIRSSRVLGTRLLCERLAACSRPPQVVVCASAIGYYGDQGDKILDESSERGKGFLADVCSEWESTAQPAIDAGIRVVFARIGIVLSSSGGALKKMLLPFRCGLGGRIASGRQYWSWVSLEDVVGAIYHSIETESLAGVINVVSPEAVTNSEFTQMLARVLRRPAMLPMPSIAARLILGEMAEELLLSSANVRPQRLLETGYHFRHPRFEKCLQDLLK